MPRKIIADVFLPPLLNDNNKQITPGNNEQMGFFPLRFNHSVTSLFSHI